jgi:phosphate transport system protein
MERHHFEEDLNALKKRLLTMGALVEERVHQAGVALMERRQELAEHIASSDQEINELQIEIDDRCLKLLALQNPMATDLRLITSAIKINADLERIGDQAVNVAKIHLVTHNLPWSEPMVQQIDEMGTLVVGMIRVAMEAFAQRDLSLCLRLPELDDPVDRLNRRMHLEALKLADDPRSLDWGMHMNLAARALERVGDNAVDIGEQVGFLITGEFREFTDASHETPVRD